MPRPLHVSTLVVDRDNSQGFTPLLEPPHRFFLGWWREVSPAKHPAWLALALFVLFRLIWSVEPVDRYFGILFKPPLIAAVLGLVVIWFFVMRTIWRAWLIERFLGLYTTG